MRHIIGCPTHQFLRTAIVANIALLLCFFVAPAARAVDYGWDGGAGDNVWDTVIFNPGLQTNWAPEAVPIATDNIILTAASAAGPVTIDVSGSREVNRIEHNGANGDYTFGDTVGADTLTIFLASGSALVNSTQNSDLILNSNILLNQGGSVLRFNSTNAADNSGHIVVHGNVSPSATATGAISLSLTTTNKAAGPWVTVNSVISDGPGATIGLIAGVETTQSESVTADHAGEVSVTGLNTFTGPIRVTGGKLIFNSIENVGSSDPSALGMPSSGNETIVMGDLNISSGTLKYVGNSTSSNASNRPIQIVDGNTAGTIDASGTVPLVLSGGISPSTSSSTTRTLNLAGSNTGDNTISGVIQPAAGAGVLNINKNGAGKWILSGNNSTLDGTVTVNAGELVVTNAIGSTSSNATRLAINSGGTFTLDGGIVAVLDLDNSGGTFNFKSGTLRLTSSTTSVGAGSMTIGTDGVGKLQLESGSQNFGDVTLQGSDDFLVATGSATYQFSNLDNSAGGTVVGISNENFQINGGLFTQRVDSGTAVFQPRIQGTGGFTKQGTGTLVFSGTLAHTYIGDTRIEGGTLQVTTSDLPTVPTFIAAGATLDLANATSGDEVGRLTGAGTVINTQFAAFTVNFAGADGDFGGSITGLGDFMKLGTGKQILSGASNYTGITTVDGGGTLEMATGGSITGSSDVRISTNSTLLVNGGTIDTPNRVRPIANTGALNIAAGLLKANQIDRTTSSTYIAPFIWTGGTVQLLSAATINGSTVTAAERPFAGSLTLDDDMALIIDDTFSVTNTGILNINGGSVTADNIITGGNINFNAGTMRMRNDQTFDAARLAALDGDAPLGASRHLVVDGMATIEAPLTLAGGSFSAGQIINPQNLILSSGTLNVTNSNLAIAAATTVDVSSGMTVAVTNGALDNAGDLNVIGGTANFAAASTNQAGGEINAINATLTFTGGLINDGDVNLINSTVDGNLVNGAGSNSSLLGSNSFGDDLVLASGDTMLIDIAGGLPNQFDVVTVGGDATLDGQLAVSLSASFTPTAGQQFTVLTAGTINDNGLVLSGSAADSFSLLVGSTSVVLQAIVPGLPGDFNGDGSVDAADYVTWRKGLGTTYSQSDYDVWRSHFGQTAGSGAGVTANAAVPEPATLFMLIMVMVVACVRRNAAA